MSCVDGSRETLFMVTFLENKLSIRPGSDAPIDQEEPGALKDKKYVVPCAKAARFPAQLWSRKNRIASSPSSAMKFARILSSDIVSSLLATIKTKDSEKIVALIIETAMTISKMPNPRMLLF